MVYLMILNLLEMAFGSLLLVYGALPSKWVWFFALGFTLLLLLFDFQQPQAGSKSMLDFSSFFPNVLPV